MLEFIRIWTSVLKMKNKCINQFLAIIILSYKRMLNILQRFVVVLQLSFPDIYQCPHICYACRNHNPVPSSFMSYHPCLYQKQHDWCHQWSRNCLPFCSTRVHPQFVEVFALLNLFSMQCFVDQTFLYLYIYIHIYIFILIGCVTDRLVTSVQIFRSKEDFRQ